MKTGLLLFQSIASSALRSGRPTVYTARRYAQQSSSVSHAKTGAAFLAAAAGVAGLAGATNTGKGASSTKLAMCSNGKGHGAAVAAPAPSEVKSIDEVDKSPEHNPLLPFPESSLRYDTYNGVTLDITTIEESTLSKDAFDGMLGKALDIWATENRKGIWIKIPTSSSHLIASATQHGFDFQHAETGYCVLTKWLPNSASRLPNGPTHQVGIGALVIHPLTGKMLAVQEKSGPAAKHKLWKMPTGLTDPGEDVATAAVRELKEETGLDCVFDRIICIRQAHEGMFNRSDMFFVCLCKLAPKYEALLKQGGDIELLPQEEEILMAEFIDFEDYADQALWKDSPLYQEMNGAMRKGIGILAADEDGDESHGFIAKNLPVGYRPGSLTIYVSSEL